MTQYKNIEKENIDIYLKALGSEYRKLNGKKQPVDIYFVGGSVILINYNFRTISGDLDGIIKGGSVFEEAIKKVANNYNLDYKWMNFDFRKTTSFTPKITKYSVFYKQFGNCVNYYTIKPECLIAMKLMSGRQYKRDLSDIVGIIKEEKDKGNIIDYKLIEDTYKDLYGNKEMPQASKILLERIKKSNDLDDLYSVIISYEDKQKEELIKINKAS